MGMPMDHAERVHEQCLRWSAWRVVVSMRLLKESSRFFSVEAVALPNLRQTLRGREPERSKRGYALYGL